MTHSATLLKGVYGQVAFLFMGNKNSSPVNPGDTVKVIRGYCSFNVTIKDVHYLGVNWFDMSKVDVSGRGYITTGKHTANNIAKCLGFRDHEECYQFLKAKYAQEFIHGAIVQY